MMKMMIPTKLPNILKELRNNVLDVKYVDQGW